MGLWRDYSSVISLASLSRLSLELGFLFTQEKSIMQP